PARRFGSSWPDTAGKQGYSMGFHPMCCVTASPPTCWRAEPTFVACRSCWGTPTSRPPRFIRTSCGRGFGILQRNTTPEPERRPGFGQTRISGRMPGHFDESRAHAMSDYIYMLESHLSPDQNRVVEDVQAASGQASVNVFLTGGAMRDMLAGFRIRDLDFAVEGNALKVAKALCENAGAQMVLED